MLTWGANKGDSPGSVTVTANSRNPDEANWQVTAVDEKATDKGFMVGGSGPLSGMLLISSNNSTWESANTTILWEGVDEGTHPTPFYVNQVINQVEAAGNYSITITFTAQITLADN